MASSLLVEYEIEGEPVQHHVVPTNLTEEDVPGLGVCWILNCVDMDVDGNPPVELNLNDGVNIIGVVHEE